MASTNQRWAQALTWIPSAYFLEGLPWVIVNSLSVVMYKTMGIDNAQITLYTSSLGLIWAFKAFWSPLVDGLSTKRAWTIGMQALMAPVLVAIGFALPIPTFFQVTLILFGLLGVLSATYDIATDGLYMLGLDEADQSAFVGVRSTFYRVAILAGEGLFVVLAGVLAERFGFIHPMNWTLALTVAASLFAVGAVYHWFMLPRPAADLPRQTGDAVGNTMEMFRTFLTKEGIVAGILFIIFFRFAENHMGKVIPLFLLDPVEAGGLGMSLEGYGVAKGTVGVIALTFGGILGGFAIYRDGLRAWMWPMVIALNVPDLLYVYMSWAQPENYLFITSLIGVESFGYGFGFTAYLMFMIRLAEGEFKTAHYAFGTGLMAFAAWAASAWSGWAQAQLGYTLFFAWVCVLTIPGVFVAWLVEVPPEFGKRDDS